LARKYLIETFGCQMNVHDSERMAGLLESAGYEATERPEDADLIVINTCSVREKAEDKLYTRIGELERLDGVGGERPVIAVAGCVAQQEGAKLFDRSPAVDVIVGPQALRRLPMLVEEARPGRPSLDINAYDDETFPLGLARRRDPVKASITIIEGCNEYCSFCVVPYTRGHERMRPVRDIVAEAEEAVRSGRREIHLLGQIVNHYHAPDIPGCDFAGLLAHVDAIPGLLRLRFASPHPRHVTPALLEAMASLKTLCRHLHLPVQSGSDRVLDRMRRRYTREEYLALVSRLRAAMPDLALTTDMIVGFPGETDGDFQETLDLVEAVGYHGIFSFKYSVRPNTLAAKRLPDDVDETTKTERIVRLQACQRDVQLRLHGSMVGSVVDVLVDGRSRRRATELSGRTSGNTVVNFPGPAELVGRLVRVRIQQAGPHSVRGDMVGVEVGAA
jgi:tRNA-2-methylthio-N6-dimethylallyladenosine synthase